MNFLADADRRADETDKLGLFPSAIETQAEALAAANADGSLALSVAGQDIGLDVPKILDWPAAAIAYALESLKITVDAEVMWLSGHSELLSLQLVPQLGAKIYMGGTLEDSQRWTPFTVTGEKSILVPATGSTANVMEPCANILRAVCSHAAGQHSHDDDCVEDVDLEGSDSMDMDRFTVTGGRSGLAGTLDTMNTPLVSVGFAFKTKLNLIATLYGSRAPAECGDSCRTLVVSSTGTLEIQPRVFPIHRLRPAKIAMVAQENAQMGEHQSALQKWRCVVTHQERQAKTGPKEKLKLSGMLHSMGVSYNAIGNGREALSCLRRALVIRQNIHGEEHPDCARTLQAIGVVRVRDGEYHEAFEYFWQALRYYEAFEPDSLDAGATLQAVAGVYGKLGEYTEALECYLRVAAIRERELGDNSLDLATTHHNLGVVFEKLSEHTEALDSLHQALAVRERRLGESHPQIARTLHAIGIVYSQLNDYTAALTYYQRALDICQHHPGEGTHVAATLNNMGVVHAKIGDTERAIEHHQQALELQDKILGPSHPDTTATRYNLHVLVLELEQSRNKSLLDHMRSFMNTSCSEVIARKSFFTPSLFSLLCEENDELDGPVDEACCCCCECCGCTSTARAMLHRSDGLPVITRDRKPPERARLGFPQPRKRGKEYPAPPPEPSSNAVIQEARDQTQISSLNKSTNRTADCNDCKPCKISL